MIFPTYLHVRDAFIRASSPRRTMFSNTRITLYTAEQRLDIIKKVIELNKVNDHDDLLQILFFAIEFHHSMVANNWDIIKYLIKEKKVNPGKVIVEDCGNLETSIFPFIIKGNHNAILKYLLRSDDADSIVETFINRFVDRLGVLCFQVNQHTIKTIRIFSEHFGNQLKLSDLKKIDLFKDILKIHSRIDDNNDLYEIIEILQGVFNEIKKITWELLPLPDELIELVLNYC